VQPAAAIYTGKRRGELWQLDLRRVEERIRAVLPDFPQVAGAYLFGSVLDFVRPQSDIDLGLILRRENPDPWEEVTDVLVETRLGRIGPHPFQVTVLRRAQGNFAFRVLTRGRLVYVDDPLWVADFIEAVARNHEDWAPFLHTYEAARGRA
jgi:predicted nucleotidyltransferase